MGVRDAENMRKGISLKDQDDVFIRVITHENIIVGKARSKIQEG